MTKWKIHRNYGYVGSDSFEIIEAEDEQEAEEAAKDYAMEKVEFWAEPFEDEDASS